MSTSVCPFCQATVPSSELERHANNHFEDEALARDLELAHQIEVTPPSPSDGHVGGDVVIDIDARYGKTSVGEDGSIHEKISCLLRMQVESDMYLVKDGLMALLRRSLESEKENSISIISGYVDHFQSVDLVDEGWGCGWRNIQMLSSHLLKQRQEAKGVLFGGCEFVPDIGSLQRWLEIAWEKGFDGLGSNQYNNKIYGLKKWIGTTECATLFRSFGLRARIVDFGPKENRSLFLSIPGLVAGAQQVNVSNSGKRKLVQVYGPMDRYLWRSGCNVDRAGSATQNNFSDSSSYIGKDLNGMNNDGSVKSKTKGHQILCDWIWNYFSDNGSAKSSNRHVIVSEKLPLYFQHDGHSRTIVGIQIKQQKKGLRQYNLLIVDPGNRTEALERSLKENIGWQKLIKRGVHTLRKPQYQLCYIESGIACGKELEQLKTLDSIFFEL